MRRAAVLAVVCALSVSCAAAEAELDRMEALPVQLATGENGQEYLVYALDDVVAEPTPTTAPPVSNPDAPIEPDPTTSQQPAEPTESEQPDSGVTTIEPIVLERFPHDGTAFTQGLAFADGVLIESIGLLGESARRRVAPATGEVISSARLDPDFFGAGLTVVDDRVIQLTWQQGTAVVSDLTTMLELSRFTYDGEGWGLCTLDDGSLVTSNGSGFLTLHDASTFDVIGEIEVTLDDQPTTNLNELECVGDSIYANVWLESDILEIDASSGNVTRVIDASALLPGDLGPDDVLNGIAYRAESNTFFLTGKRWTVMYEVSFG